MEKSDARRESLARRVAVAAVGIPIVVGAVLVGGWLFTGLVAIVAAVAVWEYAALLGKREVFPVKALVVVGAVGQVCAVHLAGGLFPALGGVLLLTVMVAWGLELGRQRGSALLNTAATVAGVGYVGGLLSAFVALRQVEVVAAVPGALVLALLGAIWSGDSAAYAVGRRWGRHALAPRVSPRKTWEGAIACFVVTAGVFWALLRWWMPAVPGVEALGAGALLGVVGQLGDLAESQLKRDVGVKDSSSLLAGHGGMLDRVDSLLFAAPALYLWLLLRGGL